MYVHELFAFFKVLFSLGRKHLSLCESDLYHSRQRFQILNVPTVKLTVQVCGGWVGSWSFLRLLAKGGVPWISDPMNHLSTEFVNSCARDLGSKRLRITLPWDVAPLKDVLGKPPQSIIPGPDWIDEVSLPVAIPIASYVPPVTKRREKAQLS